MILTKINDFSTPIKEVFESLHYKNVKFTGYLNQFIENKKVVHDFNIYLDEIFLQALKQYSNLNAFVIFNKSKNESYEIYNSLYKNNYILYGIKNISVKGDMLIKILYQLLFPRMIIKIKSEFYDYIDQYIPYVFSLFKEKSIEITLLVVCKRDIKQPLNLHHDLNKKDNFIYIPSTEEEKWHTVSTFFSSTTLKFLELQAFEFFLTKNMNDSKKMFLKYRTWLNSSIHLFSQHSFMLFSSAVLYLLGARKMSDVDLYVDTVSENSKELLLSMTLEEEYSFIDFKIKNTKTWPNHWHKWLDEWAQKSGAKYFEEIIANPMYHFYFLGVKVISLHCDIVRRIERGRPRAYTDLIALRKRYPLKYNIPVISKKYNTFINIENKSKEEIEYLLRTNNGGELNMENNEICVLNERNSIDIEKFIQTIIYFLKERYHMIFTVEEVKTELNMRSREDDINSEKNKIKKIKIIKKFN